MKIRSILNQEQLLLQKKDNLFLNRIFLQDRIKEIEEKIKFVESEKDFYKKFKKKVVNKYIRNSLQVTGTIAMVDLPSHVISNNYDTLTKFDYVIIGSTIYIISLLTFDLVNELKEYRKNNNLENIQDRRSLERVKLDIINLLEENDLEINSTISELDEVYNLLLPNNIKIKKREVN